MKAETLREYFGDMPPLDHYPLRDYREFRWEDSEVVEYITSHPQFMKNLFYQLRKSGALVFDQDSKTWRGFRYHKGCCQNSSSKPGSISLPPPSKPNTPPRGESIGGVSDGRLTPDPLLTAEGGFDSGKKSKAEVRDEPW